VSEPEFTIPRENLPPGFAESLEKKPTQIADSKPAATIVLLREGADGLEVLLLRRVRSSGFVPGAWASTGRAKERTQNATAMRAPVERMTPPCRRL
jgi:hypothetical protein